MAILLRERPVFSKNSSTRYAEDHQQNPVMLLQTPEIEIECLDVHSFIERNWTPAHAELFIRRVHMVTDGVRAFREAVAEPSNSRSRCAFDRGELAKFLVVAGLTGQFLRHWADDIAQREASNKPQESGAGQERAGVGPVYGSSAEEDKNESCEPKAARGQQAKRAQNIQDGNKKHIPFWIMRLFDEWSEHNEDRKAKGRKPLPPPGSRKVMKYLEAHGFTMSHVTANQHLKDARALGLLDPQWDITDGRIVDSLDPNEATAQGEYQSDRHTPSQRKPRPDNDK